MQPPHTIGIIGFGKEGKSARAFLQKIYPRATIDVLDQKQGKNYLARLHAYDLAVKSPGVPWHVPEIARAIKKGMRITTPTTLFFEHAKGTIIGITGTKGKGTTATLLYKMLNACGKNVFLAGNIGTPMLDILPRVTKKSITVLELSSFQLERLPFSPHVAVVLDIFPDHLNYHRSMREYVNAKSSLAAHQKQQDRIFFFAHSPHARHIAQKSKAKKYGVDTKKFDLFRQHELRLLGAHNFANAVMAATVARHCGVPEKTIKKVATAFRGNAHRLEFVARKKGVAFYNDSAATIPQATIAAINSINQPIMLIMGGASKNIVDMKQLERTIAQTPNIKAVFAHMKLRDAFAAAVRKAEKGDVVLLSPGATSFDQFRNYEERGNLFKQLVKDL